MAVSKVLKQVATTPNVGEVSVPRASNVIAWSVLTESPGGGQAMRHDSSWDVVESRRFPKLVPLAVAVECEMCEACEDVKMPV
jgi:hypothetical protein